MSPSWQMSHRLVSIWDWFCQVFSFVLCALPALLRVHIGLRRFRPWRRTRCFDLVCFFFGKSRSLSLGGRRRISLVESGSQHQDRPSALQIHVRVSQARDLTSKTGEKALHLDSNQNPTFPENSVRHFLILDPPFTLLVEGELVS